MHAPSLPSDVPPVEPAGASLFPRQPHLAAAVATTALHGQDLWPPLAAAPHLTTASAWAADPSLEPDQSFSKTPEETFLADASGMPSLDPEGSQRQFVVFETRTKNPLAD